MSAWKLQIEKDVAVLELDLPDTDVNVLTSENLKEFSGHLDEIHRRSGELKILLVTSAKPRFFVAGADIKEIRSITTEEEAFKKAEAGKEVFQKLADLPQVTVAVINGACLGGGYELALSCDFIVTSFSDHVKIGLPEVKLGILPGFGGSIRLPRRVGLLRALPLILSGSIVDGRDAFRKGMVDAVVADQLLKEESVKLARRAVEKGVAGARKQKEKFIPMNWFLEKTPWGRKLVFKRARTDVKKRAGHFYPAPFEILDLLEKTVTDSSAHPFRLESEHFARLGATDVSKNLIHVFFLSEQYKKRKWTGTEGRFPVTKCGVIGAGVMGGGIAQLVSYRNIPVRIRDIQEQALGNALREARRIYQGAMKRRKILPHEVEYKMGLISAGLSTDGLKSCDILIEAVVEDMEIKKKVFRELSGLAAPDAVLASNTSSLSITEMGSATPCPDRVVGLHFFNPVHRMPLVEVIRGEKTSDSTAEKVIQFSRQLGKTVIVVKDRPGFLVNRLLLPYLNEAAHLMEEGLSPEVLDRLATRFGMPMGPVELVDQVGVDVGYKVAHILQEAFGARMQVAGILENVYKQKFLGKKTGKGFYLYAGKDKTVNPAVSLGTRPRQTREADALKRMILIMINEAAYCLEEGVVDSAATVDIGMIMGTGFPPFRGGLLRYADTLGAEAIVQDLTRFGAEVDAARFSVSPFLKDLVRRKASFY